LRVTKSRTSKRKLKRRPSAVMVWFGRSIETFSLVATKPSPAVAISDMWLVQGWVRPSTGLGRLLNFPGLADRKTKIFRQSSDWLHVFHHRNRAVLRATRPPWKATRIKETQNESFYYPVLRRLHWLDGNPGHGPGKR
jgi:hypothetical protein